MAFIDNNKAYLIALDASLSSREYVLDSGRALIGRDGNRCEVVAAGVKISRKHAQISWREGQPGNFLIEDLGSTNGLFINGCRIDSGCVLKDGDLIGLGSSNEQHLCFQAQSRKHVSWVATLPEQPCWSLGRSSENDISLPFESVVSAHHSMLFNRKGILEIVDKDSLNGIWVNGNRMRKARITPADTVVIGSTYFHFTLKSDNTLEISRRECGDDIQLDCVGVSYTVKTKDRQTKNILDDITLSIKPGEFVGILGPSGAGKSTLLKSLNGYIQPTAGSVLLNETSLHHAYDMFRNVIGYVPQDDILHQELTVEKSLEYVSRLRLPLDFHQEQRMNIIDSTLEALGLSYVRHHTIEQLSGGQRKRVSIGAELLTKPSVLFLDEPTSGLDPSVEEKIMRHFKKMAQQGTTVLITTHILYSLNLLDRIIILSQGKLVFFGTPAEAMDFFQPADSQLTSPIEIFDLLEQPSGKQQDNTMDYSKDFRPEIAYHYSTLFNQSAYYQDNITKHQTRMAGKISSGTDTFLNLNSTKRSGALTRIAPIKKFKGFFPWRDCLTLTRRHVNLRVNSLSRALLYGLIPVLLALVTLSQSVPGLQGDEKIAEEKSSLAGKLSVMTPMDEHLMKRVLVPSAENDSKPLYEVIYSLKNEGVQNLPVPMSIMVMCVMTAVFLGTICTCLEVSTEKSVYERERMSSLRIADYLGAKLPLVFLITFLQCCLFLGLLFCSPNMWDVPFYYACPTMVAVAWSSACLGLLISSIDPTRGQLSVIFAIAAVLPQLILSGGLGPDYYNGMNSVGKMIANCIPARWGLEMMLTAIYQPLDLQSTEWIPRFVSKTVGFSFGNMVVSKGMGILAFQAGCWLLLCAWVLKRKDKSHV